MALGVTALQAVADADRAVLEDKAGKRFNVAEVESALDDTGDTIVVLRAGEAVQGGKPTA